MTLSVTGLAAKIKALMHARKGDGGTGFAALRIMHNLLGGKFNVCEEEVND